ncbi:cyclin-D4-1-like isoform X2 [Zingiber officinale]|uniref:cyclin-D4-1-like isoform X2 n=1 Tax=Zingiber officinale TaxID=94328 RepID=UPI001C4D8C96|nr:cyclin-D4-1-like isoform X2 [Zingiber officinale]
MAPSYDYASSVLLCVEDNSCILGFDDDGFGAEEDNQIICLSEAQRCRFNGDPFIILPPQSDDYLGVLIQRESEYMPREDYGVRLRSEALDSSIRRDAVDWIMKVHDHYNFGPSSAYLSVNYLDRFLSNYELPKDKAWMTQLLSVACLSLAAKMEETEVPLSLDLQVGEAKYVFEARTIQRMELLVLSTLKWRMQAVTPFSFIDFFLHKFSGVSVLDKVAVSRSIALILTIIRGTDFLAFRSSEIASAISLLVLETVDIEKAVAGCSYVSKEKVIRCYGMIKDVESMSISQLKYDNISFFYTPQSPINVLDAACLSYNSDETNGESQRSNHNSSGSKRRKISRT